MKRPGTLFALAASTLLTLGPATAGAEDKPKLGWSALATFSGVWTRGNTDTTTFGFKGRVDHKQVRDSFFFEGGGLKQTSSEETIFAVARPDDFTVVAISTPTTQAENYFAGAGYEHRISERFFWNAGAGWNRDTFAGIDYIVTFGAGAGYVFWTAKDRGEFKGALQVTLNNQQETIPNPDSDDTFVALGAGFNFFVAFGKEGKSVFRSKLDLAENLQVVEDFRLYWTNTLTVAMTDRFALQVGARENFRNLPALQQINLFAVDPGPGIEPIGTVLTPYDKLDSIFTVALVINWGAKAAKESLPKP